LSDVRARTLITVQDLAESLKAQTPLVLLDVQDEKATARARPLIPHAIATFLDADFSGAPSKHAGKRPLPEIADLQAKAQSFGINPDSLVVVYDDKGGAQASRAWWTLRWAGFDNVRILDGGLQAWLEAGHAISQDPAPAPGGGTITLSPGHLRTIEADEAAAIAHEGVLLDTRGKAAYVGAPQEPGKPATGHIPGALSAPATDALADDGRFKSGEELRAYFAALGANDVQQIGVYCGSGNAAAHSIAALSATGLEAALYVGSWSAWSADPARPAAIGEERGGEQGA
jgi:thiosulfate/3-mercaptopyruvate sulfurtransferase